MKTYLLKLTEEQRQGITEALREQSQRIDADRIRNDELQRLVQEATDTEELGNALDQVTRRLLNMSEGPLPRNNRRGNAPI